MSERLKVIEFPGNDIGELPRALRSLADQIEAGEYGDAHNLAWVVDCGAGRIEIGLLGQTAEPGAIAHYLFALGQRKLESVAE